MSYKHNLKSLMFVKNVFSFNEKFWFSTLENETIM